MEKHIEFEGKGKQKVNYTSKIKWRERGGEKDLEEVEKEDQ